MGCTKASARENDKGAARFKVRGVEINWPEESKKKDDWTRRGKVEVM